MKIVSLLVFYDLHLSSILPHFNPNTGLFEGSFFWGVGVGGGGEFERSSNFKKN